MLGWNDDVMVYFSSVLNTFTRHSLALTDWKYWQLSSRNCQKWSFVRFWNLFPTTVWRWRLSARHLQVFIENRPRWIPETVNGHYMLARDRQLNSPGLVRGGILPPRGATLAGWRSSGLIRWRQTKAETRLYRGGLAAKLKANPNKTPLPAIFIQVVRFSGAGSNIRRWGAFQTEMDPIAVSIEEGGRVLALVGVVCFLRRPR